MPKKIIWAWERPEDLRFADPKEFGVAFLAQTLVLQGDEIIYKPRRQPLEAAPGAYIIAVTRVETIKQSGKRPSFSDAQRSKLVDLIKNTLEPSECPRRPDRLRRRRFRAQILPRDDERPAPGTT